MMEQSRGPNVIANFWEWYERRQQRDKSPLAKFALDRCDETFRRCDWDRFGYWFSIYRRERPRARNSGVHRGR
jgi:hypothetical protein